MPFTLNISGHMHQAEEEARAAEERVIELFHRFIAEVESVLPESLTTVVMTGQHTGYTDILGNVRGANVDPQAEQSVPTSTPVTPSDNREQPVLAPDTSPATPTPPTEPTGPVNPTEPSTPSPSEPSPINPVDSPLTNPVSHDGMGEDGVGESGPTPPPVGV